MDPMGKEWMGGFETIFEVDFSGWWSSNEVNK